MGKRIKSKSEPDGLKTFTPDLSASVSNEGGLTSALEGFNEAPKEDLPSFDLALSEPELTPTGRIKKPRKPREPKEPEVDLLAGEDIQMFIDLVIPMAISGIHNMTNEKKMSPDDLMLTPKQEEKMNKLAQRVAERLKMNMNPYLALGIGVAVGYGGNYIKNKP